MTAPVHGRKVENKNMIEKGNGLTVNWSENIPQAEEKLVKFLSVPLHPEAPSFAFFRSAAISSCPIFCLDGWRSHKSHRYFPCGRSFGPVARCTTANWI